MTPVTVLLGWVTAPVEAPLVVAPPVEAPLVVAPLVATPLVVAPPGDALPELSEPQPASAAKLIANMNPIDA
jgi:hypothetical protein